MFYSPNIRICALACFVLCCTAARQSVHAQAKTALSWVREQGAESCIGATELGRRVEQLVGPVLASAPEGQISIEGGIKKSGAGFEADVAVSDAAGHLLGRRRVLGADADCRKLDDQIAFVIAVAIDPNAALAQLPGEFAQDTKPEVELLHELEANPPKPAPVPLRQPVEARQPAGPAASDAGGLDWHFGGSIGAAAGLGVMPHAGPGLSAAFSVWTGTWSHHLQGTYWLSQRQAIEGAVEVEFGLPELALSTCPQLWADGGFRLAGCAGITLARLSVEPHGFIGSAHALWLAGPLLSVRFVRALAGPLSVVLAAGAEGLWPRHRIEYELSGEPQPIWQMPAISGRADVSLELRF